jgi:protein-disulfide isomerase
MNRSIQDRLKRGQGAILALATAAILSGGWMVAACAAQPEGAADAQGAAAGSDVVAEVMGQKVTRADLESEAAEPLDQVEAQLAQCQRQAEQSRYQVLETSLLQLIQDRLLTAEAEAQGKTKDELIAAEIDAKIAEVTDAEVDTWYAENQARIGNRPKESIAPQVKQFLAQERQVQARQTYMNTLEAKYESRVLLEPPRVQVAATGPSKGPDNAPITIVEFSDFECPFCSRINPTLAQVRETYGEKVRIVFRQFPLGMHPNAQKAAEASLCAHDQSKFWEMHDLMFEDQRALGVDQLKAKASQLGLEAEAFNGCLDSGKYADQVQADMQAGTEAGVSGTPALFINGISISGAVPYEQVAPVIDAELERKGLTD